MKKPERLWILTNEYEPYIIGGLGSAATNLTKAYARIGAKPIVISRGQRMRKAAVRSQGRIRIVRFPMNRRYFSIRSGQYRPKAMKQWLTTHRIPLPEAIHVHSIEFADFAIYSKRKHRIPFIYTSHSLIASEQGIRRKKLKAMRAQVGLLKQANRIAAPSRSEKRQIIKRYPFAASKTVVIPHGVSPRRKAPRGPRHRLLYVGRIVPGKGIESLLKSISLLKQRHPKVTLSLIGKGPRSYTKRLQRIARKHGVSSRVRWLGYRSPAQVQRAYSSYGAVIMPSSKESFGLVALEALASGIPLVSTRAGGLAEFVNSKVAQTISRTQSKAIARAVRLMWKHGKLTERRAAAGRRLAAKYTWRHAAHRYLRLIGKIK